MGGANGMDRIADAVRASVEAQVQGTPQLVGQIVISIYRLPDGEFDMGLKIPVNAATGNPLLKTVQIGALQRAIRAVEDYKAQPVPAAAQAAQKRPSGLELPPGAAE